MSLALIEKEREWVLPTRGRTVSRCVIDHAFSLDLWSPEDVITLRLQGEFKLHIAGKGYRLSPESPDGPTSLAPALALLHKGVGKGIAYKDGALKLDFHGGEWLSVEPDDHFEAWDLTSDSEEPLRIVCLPGGQLAVWRPTRRLRQR